MSEFYGVWPYLSKKRPITFQTLKFGYNSLKILCISPAGGGGERGRWMGLEDFCFVSIKFTWSPHKVVIFWWFQPHWQLIGSHSSTILLKFCWRLLISQSVPPENNVIPKILYPTPSAINFDSVPKSANLIYILYFNTLGSYFVVRTASSY